MGEYVRKWEDSANHMKDFPVVEAMGKLIRYNGQQRALIVYKRIALAFAAKLGKSPEEVEKAFKLAIKELEQETGLDDLVKEPYAIALEKGKNYLGKLTEEKKE